MKLRKKSNRMGASLNIPVTFEDGRTVMSKSGHGKTLIVRQVWDGEGLPPKRLDVGQEVRSVLRNGRLAVMQVTKRTGKGERDIHLRILGSEPPPGEEAKPDE